MEFLFIAVLYGTRITYDVTKTSSTILKVFDNHDEKNMTLYLTRNAVKSLLRHFQTNFYCKIRFKSILNFLQQRGKLLKLILRNKTETET